MAYTKDQIDRFELKDKKIIRQSCIKSASDAYKYNEHMSGNENGQVILVMAEMFEEWVNRERS